MIVMPAMVPGNGVLNWTGNVCQASGLEGYRASCQVTSLHWIALPAATTHNLFRVTPDWERGLCFCLKGQEGIILAAGFSNLLCSPFERR